MRPDPTQGRHAIAASVFFVPHQDDEVLTLGAAIREDVRAAEAEPYVVLVTDGASSGARLDLEEKFGISLSHAAFSDARDRELIDCTTTLGVPAENLYFENLLDGAVTLDSAREVIGKYAQTLRAVTCTAVSFMDKHPDHHYLGRALDELAFDSELVGEARFCISRNYYGDAPTPDAETLRTDDVLLEAAEAYGVFDPERLAGTDSATGPRYAIGYESVPGDFTQLREHPVSYVHSDSSGMSRDERKDANEWLEEQGFAGYL